MCCILLPIQEGGKVQEEQPKVKSKFRKGMELLLSQTQCQLNLVHAF